VQLTRKEVNGPSAVKRYRDEKILFEEAAGFMKRSLRSVYRMEAEIWGKGSAAMPKERICTTGFYEEPL
jgi:hypothetical protein